MPAARGLKRLQRVRELQEGQSRLMVESAREERDRLRRSLAASVERTASGRVLVHEAVRSGNLAECIVGHEEQAYARRLGSRVSQAIAAAELHLDDLRSRYLSARAEKLQVEALIARRQQNDMRESERKDQHVLDQVSIAGFLKKNQESRRESKP